MVREVLLAPGARIPPGTAPCRCPIRHCDNSPNPDRIPRLPLGSRALVLYPGAAVTTLHQDSYSDAPLRAHTSVAAKGGSDP